MENMRAVEVHEAPCTVETARRSGDTIVIFDFDWSFIDENTDTYVIEKLAPELYKGEFESLRKDTQWTILMDLMVGNMTRNLGISRESLAACLQGIPYFIEMFEAAKFAAASGAKLYIVSDSNEFYINEILNHHGLRSIWANVYTNKASFNEGILRIGGHHDSTAPHECSRCPTNMCKGKILSEILASEPNISGPRRVIYVGDGGGDSCPCLRLKENDVVCCRRDWKLHQVLVAEQCRAIVEPWTTGEDVLNIFMRVIND
jgi:pyridoxal phosphate phosphatase PHOSPHO2